jgi:antirestriction protein ArdC
MAYKKNFEKNYDPEKAKEQAIENAKKLHGTLKGGIEELLAEMKQGKSERLLNYMKFASKFHNYSPNNQLLIMLECWFRGIDPVHVAGMHTWNDLGFHVKKGEKGIPIFAPMIIKEKDKETGAETGEVFTLFKVVYVWADCQVVPFEEGTKMPTFFSPIHGDAAALYNRLADVVRHDGIQLEEVESGLGTAQGVSYGGKIKILKNESTNMFLTLIHEYTHELLHQRQKNDLSKQTKECHAEAVSYIVSHHFGIHNPFSSDYLQNWGNDEKSLQAELETVQQCAATIIDAMEVAFQQKQAETAA